MSVAYQFEKQSSPQPWPILFSLFCFLCSCPFSIFYLEVEEREEVEIKTKITVSNIVQKKRDA